MLSPVMSISDITFGEITSGGQYRRSSSSGLFTGGFVQKLIG
jgi:hypothetical protein